MWQLPFLVEGVPEHERSMTVRHAIMQVNYVVHVWIVEEDEVNSLTAAEGERRWVLLDEAGTMALTGLARKVLTRADLLTGKSSARSMASTGQPHTGLRES
jgi:hypothetical protein